MPRMPQSTLYSAGFNDAGFNDSERLGPLAKHTMARESLTAATETDCAVQALSEGSQAMLVGGPLTRDVPRTPMTLHSTKGGLIALIAWCAEHTTLLDKLRREVEM